MCLALEVNMFLNMFKHHNILFFIFDIYTLRTFPQVEDNLI